MRLCKEGFLARVGKFGAVLLLSIRDNHKLLGGRKLMLLVSSTRWSKEGLCLNGYCCCHHLSHRPGILLHGGGCYYQGGCHRSPPSCFCKTAAPSSLDWPTLTGMSRTTFHSSFRRATNPTPALMATEASGAADGARRRSTRTNKGVWTVTSKEGLWEARRQLAPEDEEERYVSIDG